MHTDSTSSVAGPGEPSGAALPSPRGRRLQQYLEECSQCQVPPEEDDFMSTFEAIADPLSTSLTGIDLEQEDTTGDTLDYDKFDIGDINYINYPWQGRLHMARLWTPTLRDKVSFVIGNAMLWTMAYWLGWSPQSFYRLYTGEVLVLGALRYGMYRTRKWHYYLFDFCYFANALLLVHLWWAPRVAWLHKVVFAYSAGPLTWSILAFRNSLVYHDLDKVASVFFHLWPACVAWTLRWHPDTAKFGPGPDADADTRAAWQQAGFSSLVLIPMLAYTGWAVAYYLKIFVISANRIKERGYATLFNYTTTRTKGVYAAIAKRVPKQVQPVVYLLLHALFCTTTSALSIACWHSFTGHTLLLCFMGAASVWHGASYYFEVFARGNLKLGAAAGDGAHPAPAGARKAD